MRRAHRLFVFLLFAGYGSAGNLDSAAGFGIVSIPDRSSDAIFEKTISAARLRHKPARKAAAAFARSAKLAEAGALDEGAVELQKAIAIDPDFSEAHGNLGATYVHMGRYEDAAGELRRAIALDPASSHHHANLAIALLLMNRPDDAEMEAQTAAGLDGANFRAQYLFGVLLSRRASTMDSAIPHLVYAARYLPEAHLRLARVFEAKGEAQRARSELSRYKLLNARKAPAQPQLGDLRNSLR